MVEFIGNCVYISCVCLFDYVCVFVFVCVYIYLCLGVIFLFFGFIYLLDLRVLCDGWCVYGCVFMYLFMSEEFEFRGNVRKGRWRFECDLVSGAFGI